MRKRERNLQSIQWRRYAINHKSWSCSGPRLHSSGSAILGKEVIYDRKNPKLRGRYKDGPCIHKMYEVHPLSTQVARTGYTFEACTGLHAIDSFVNWHSSFNPLLAYVEDFVPPSAALPNPSRSDIYDRISNPYGNNFFETAFSLRSGLSSLAGSVSGKLRALRSLPKPRIPRNRAELWKLRKAGGSALSSYLEWEFGWKQAGEDVARLLAFAKSMQDHLDKIERERGKPIRMGFLRTESFSKPFSVGAFEGCITGTSVSRLSYRLSYDYPASSLHSQIPSLRKAINNLSRSMEFWGLSISAKRTWELVPGSWLVDQVLPISDFLSDFGQGESLFGDRAKISFLGSTTSVTTSYEGYADFRWAKLGGAYRNSTETTRFKFHGTYYSRKLGYQPPPIFSIRPRGSIDVSDTGKAYLGLLALNKLK